VRIRALGFAAFAGLVLLLCGVPAHGQNSVTLTNVNGSTSGGDLSNNTGGPSEDVYTGIYYATVDSSVNTPVICDDFNHNVSIGETWQATAINTQSLNSGNIGQTEFGATIGLVGYAEVATLVSEIFTLNNTTAASFAGLSNVTGTDLAEAIWDITTPGGIKGITSNAASLVSWVENLFSASNPNALNAQAVLKSLNLWILTPNPNDGPQEFWATGTVVGVVTPEGGASFMFLLLAGFSCFGAMFFRYRNQLGSGEAA